MPPASKHRAPAPPLEYRMLLTATLCLLAGGAVMVYSASSARDLLAGHGDGTGYLVKYVMYGAIGLVLMRLLSRRGLELVRQATPLLLVAGFAGLLAVLVPGIGMEINGAKRWVGAGSLQFQPSELMKLALVLYAAQLVSAQPRRVRSVKGLVNPLLLIVGAACLLVMAEPDLGTALVIAFSLAALLVAGGVPLKHLGEVAGIAVFLVVV